MKNIIKIIIIGIFSIGIWYACTCEEYDTIDESRLPDISDMEITITPDSTNTKLITFHLENEECVPIWIFSSSKRVTQNDYQKKYSKSGTYSVEVKVYNRNGISDGSVVKEFEVE